MAGSPAAAWCCRWMPANAPCQSISCRWNWRFVPTSARRAIAINGAVVWLTGLPASGKSTLARALERAAVRQRRLADPARRRHACAPASTATLASPRRIAREYPQACRSRYPSGAQRPYRDRRRGFAVARRTARPHAASPTPRFAKSTSRPRPKSARAATPRAITPGRAPVAAGFTGIGNDYQPPTASELAIDTSARLGHRCHRRHRADAGQDRAFCSTNRSIWLPIFEPAPDGCLRKQIAKAFLGATALG